MENGTQKWKKLLRLQKRTSKQMTLELVQMAILLALIVVLQTFGTSWKLPNGTSLSFVLIPIALGGMMFGPINGAVLGLIFGAITFFAGVSGADLFTATLYNAHPFMTGLICFGKGMMAGFMSGLVYWLLEGKNKLVATILAAITAPIVNTGLFAAGSLLVLDTMTAMASGSGHSFVHFLFIICIGVNFLAEFLLNLIVSPSLHRVLTVITKRMR